MMLPTLSAGLLALLAAIAIASLLVPAVALAAVRRRSAPLRHGVLMCALSLLAFVPAAPVISRQLNPDWLPRWNVLDSLPQPVGQLAAAAMNEDLSAGFRTLSADEIPAGAILPGKSVTANDAATSPATGSASSRTSASSWSPSWLDRRLLATSAIALWALGAGLSLLGTLRAATRVTRIVRRAQPVTDASARILFQELAGELRLRRTPELRAAVHLRVPFAWGFLRPVVVVSQNMIEPCDSVRLRPILLHELAHVRRRDVWIGLLQRVVAACYWWNPLVHRLNARLADAREDICDAYVLNSGCSSREYAEILVDLAAQLALPHPAAALGLLNRSEPQLTRRVQRLLEDQPMSTSLRILARVALLGFFIVLTTTAVLMAYVLIDNRMRDHSIPQFASFEVHPNWTPPQPTNVAPVYPASQQFTPSVSGTTSAPVMMGDDEMGMAGMEGGMMLADDDPFRPTHNDSDEFNAPMIAQGFGVGAAEVPSAGRLVGVADEDSMPAFGRAAAGQGVAIAMPGGAAMAGMPGGRQLHVMSGDRLRGLAVIELLGNDDGTLKEVRWFTESLGTGAEAIAKLTERLTAFAQPRTGAVYRMEVRDTPNGPAAVNVPVSGGAGFGSVTLTPSEGDTPFFGGDPAASRFTPTADAIRIELTAQITASPELRYAYVARVVELCEEHVQRVVVTQSNLTPQVTLTLGFVRDGSGNQISSSPVLIWNGAVTPGPVDAAATSPDALPLMSQAHDEIVTVESLTPRLLTWRQTQSGDAVAKNLTMLVRADAGVDPKLVEQVVQVALPAGIERVVLLPLESPTAPTAEFSPAVDPAGVPASIAPEVQPSANSLENVPAVDPAPIPENTDPTSAPESRPMSHLPGEGVRIVMPVTGPVPIPIDFDQPLLNGTDNREHLFNFYVGITP